eukprot:scaffold63335_cov57-Phaeocystis_antarctica.AAC.1
MLLQCRPHCSPQHMAKQPMLRRTESSLPRKGPRKGAATTAVATNDRLSNRDRQSLAQATQLAATLYLANPGMIYAVKHVVTARKGTTLIIFDRGRRQQVQAAGEDGEDEDEDEDEDVAPAAAEPKPKPKGKPKPSAKPPQPASRPPPPAMAGGARPTPAATPAATPPAKQQGAGAGTEQRKLDRNALSACGDSARATAGSQAHDRELDSQELSSLCSAARAIAQEVYSARRVYSPTDRSHPLIIDGRDCGIEHGGLPVISNSRAARLLNKDPRDFGAAVKQLYLSGSAGG